MKIDMEKICKHNQREYFCLYCHPSKCAICSSINLVGVKNKRFIGNSSYIEYLVKCNDCGQITDLFNINDGLYKWNCLPEFSDQESNEEDDGTL